jgi:hypothetical protein
MDRIRQHLPAPATLIALLALMVALGGSAYAASVAKNSVGSGQVKNGSLKGADIKDNKLTGKDIDEDSLVGVDAGEVGGLPAVGLGTRIASDFNAGDNYLEDDGNTDVNKVIFKVPIRSVVKVEISGWFVGNAATDCPCVVWAFGRLSNESGSSAGGQLLSISNLTAYVGGFARVPYSGLRTLVLDPGTYTFLHSVRKQDGANATKSSVGSANSRLVVTSFPFDGSGAVPLRPAPAPAVRPSGSTR